MDRYRYIAHAVVLLGVLVAALFARQAASDAHGAQPAAVCAQSGQREPLDKVDSRVRSTMRHVPAGRQISVIVALQDQADLSHIDAPDRATRLRNVQSALQATARRTQGPIMTFLGVHRGRGNVGRVTGFWVFNGLSIEATRDVIEALAARPDVRSITPDDVSIVAVGAPGEAAAAANLGVVNAPALWRKGFYGQGVVAAVLDSGADATHPDLARSYRGGPNSWFDPFGQHPGTPMDPTGHGTSSLGLMVAGDGSGRALGIAPQATWIAARVFDDAGRSTATAIHRAFEWVLDPDGDPDTVDAPHVVNNSWTFASPGCDLEFRADVRALRAAGIVPVFAAGAFGPASGTSASPANYPEALAVGGLDNAGTICDDSSRGPAACGEDPGVYPELVAPAVDVVTTDRDGLYTTATGTSIAAPHVAGALALLLSAFPGASAADQTAALLGTAVDGGPAGPDNTFGFGRLDAERAFRKLASVEPIVVTMSEDVIAEDGQCSLREAVIAANTDQALGGCAAGSGADTIRFAPAVQGSPIVLTTSGADENDARTGDLDLTSAVTILGPAVEGTADGTPTIVVDGNGADRVFEVRSGAQATIAGLTLTHGSAGPEGDGGGVLVNASAGLTLAGTHVTGNAALRGGGAMVAGQLSVSHGTVGANQGGGILNDGGLVTLTDAIVGDNEGGYGVGNQNRGTLTVDGAEITGNPAGGVYNSAGRADLTHVRVAGNHGIGGIFSSGGANTRVRVSHSAVISNTATSGAGIANAGVNAVAEVNSTRIEGNSATDAGGGIHNAGIMMLSECLVAGNTARVGGGINHSGARLDTMNVTISGNDAADNGGGLYSRNSASIASTTFSGNRGGDASSGGNVFVDESEVSFRNTILANAPERDNCAVSGGTVHSLGHNVETSDTCALGGTADQTGVDAGLAPLADNGGDTLTHALLPGSPAVDAGDATCPSTDQRGLRRPQGAACDVGSYEAGEWADLGVTTTAPDGIVDAGSAFTLSLEIVNTGPGTAAAVILTDEPGASTFVSAAVRAGAGTCAYDGRVRCSLADLRPQERVGVDLVLRAPASAGATRNTATVAASTLDLHPANNVAVTSVEVRKIWSAFLPLAWRQ